MATRQTKLMNIYKPLDGLQFRGIFKRKESNQRDLIVIKELKSEVGQILSKINADVLQIYGGKGIWKAIIGPEDSPNNKEYWLYVDSLADELEENGEYDCQVRKIEAFQFNGSWKGYKRGVNIYVEMLPSQNIKKAPLSEVEQIKKEIKEIYNPLVGLIFEGTFKKRWEMPSTGGERDVIVIEEPEASKILLDVSTNVLKKYPSVKNREMVWKAITRSDDHHWLMSWRRRTYAVSK